MAFSATVTAIRLGAQPQVQITQATYQETIEMVNAINDEIAVINAQNSIYGTDTYIQSTEPTNAK